MPEDLVLPAQLANLFWEYDFSQLDWEADRDLVIGRVLSHGDWDAVRWLLQRLGKRQLRRWIEDRSGRGLDPQQLRFWQLILGLPPRQVTAWIRTADPAWAGRTRPPA